MAPEPTHPSASPHAATWAPARARQGEPVAKLARQDADAEPATLAALALALADDAERAHVGEPCQVARPSACARTRYKPTTTTRTGQVQ